MATYHAELLETAERLIARGPRQSGSLPAAQIRRSISTSYYALFHFLLDDASRRLVGNAGRKLTRRRIVMRVFTHAGVKSTLNKIRGQTMDASLAAFLQQPLVIAGASAAPDFAKVMAAVFIEAHGQRRSADYDLNTTFSETDARKLHDDCREAIEGWQKARNADQRDFKDALAVVMLLKGQLRKDD